MRNLLGILLLAFLASAQGLTGGNPPVAPVAGVSWLNHLHRFYGDSSMGKSWRLGSSVPEQDKLVMLSLAALTGNGMVTLRGADLYRLNCQGCHGAEGLGAPPEIASLINPIRSTSFALVSERMKKAGAALSRRDIMELVKQSQAALLLRLHEGGTDMPGFPDLSELEIRSLVAYLNQLAGVPGAGTQQIAVRETPDRVGELLVKSTCHVCHDATGVNPTPAQFEQGDIPPLSALPLRVNRAQLVEKVTRGAAAPMNPAGNVFRGRMPVLEHISPSEAAAVYQYLVHYPPAEVAAPVVETASVQSASAVTTDIADNFPTRPPNRAPPAGEFSSTLDFPIYAGSCVVLVFLCAVWFTLRELKKLANRNRRIEGLNASAVEMEPETMREPQLLAGD